MAFHVPNQYRIRTGQYGSDERYGNNGAFSIPNPLGKRDLHAIAADQYAWDHVSVSTSNRHPTWEEMSYIKGIFWDNEDAVVEIHHSDVDQNQQFTLHLWRPQNAEIPIPKKEMV